MSFKDLFQRALTGATATNGAPSASTDGVPIPANCDRAVLLINNSAGSGGSLSVTIKVWGYSKRADDASGDGWFPLGVNATAADKGKLNEGNAIAEIAANDIRHAEELFGLLRLDRLYLEITAIAGTSNTIEAWAHFASASAVTAG